MTIREIASIIGTLQGNGNDSIKWLITDSRTLSFPEETLFFALKTKRNDGHRYIGELIAKGVRNFVVENLPEEKIGCNFVVVKNSLDALQKLVAHHRKQFNIPVIGITGSNGKTIVKEWLAQMIHDERKTVRSPRSYNSQIGVPLSVWQLDSDTQTAIFEAGISQPGEMTKLEKIIKPTIGIFTNIGEAHQENFVSMKEKCLEKLKLFCNSETVIYSIDNKLIDICVEQSELHNKKFTWGKSSNADMQITDISSNADGTDISIFYRKEKNTFHIPFSDAASIENAIHCIAAMILMKFDITYIQNATRNLQPVAMRLEVKRGVNNCTIINDSYNSDFSSLSIALDFLQQQNINKNRKRTVILSDIEQSGLGNAELYGNIAHLLKNKGVTRIIGIGSEISSQKKVFEKFDNAFFGTTNEFLQSNAKFENEAILLKGARKFQFENISRTLEFILHQTTLEVNLTALIENFNYFKSRLKPETKIVSMVKANAYGSGSNEVSIALQQNKCDFLAVAVADEGAELRSEGITMPILVMNPEKHSFPLLFEHHLEPEIYSFELLEDFITEAERQGMTDYPIHIKVDTGMHRLGFMPDEADRLIARIKSQNNVKIRSVFSHLVGADSPKFDDFTEEQVTRFKVFSEKLTDAFEHKILRHILNSPGIERFPQYQFDMVRLGIGHYGMSAIGHTLRNVCSLKTTILQTKEVPANETVGYSRKGKLTRDSRTATIPVGYADGLNRKLGNGVGKVMINGKIAPIIGNICMDCAMVDITGIDAKAGDTVEIFGDNISIEKMAESIGTISYEILTGISKRVKRVYFQE